VPETRQFERRSGALATLTLIPRLSLRRVRLPISATTTACDAPRTPCCWPPRPGRRGPGRF